jgi:hypothetical protein
MTNKCSKYYKCGARVTSGTFETSCLVLKNMHFLNFYNSILNIHDDQKEFLNETFTTLTWKI